MKKFFPSFLLLFFLLLLGYENGKGADRDEIQKILEKMKGHFQQLQDYSCEVEQVYFKNNGEDERIFFTYYFRKDNRIRVDFFYPQSGVTILYRKGEEKATILPFRSLPGFKFRLSIHNPMLSTFTGQQIYQTDMGYFIKFLEQNLGESRQPNFDIIQGEGEVTFLLIARDYIRRKTPEKYRITLSRALWVPLQIERFSIENIPIEKSLIRNYIFNAHPGDKFFLP